MEQVANSNQSNVGQSENTHGPQVERNRGEILAEIQDVLRSRSNDSLEKLNQNLRANQYHVNSDEQPAGGADGKENEILSEIKKLPSQDKLILLTKLQALTSDRSQVAAADEQPTESGGPPDTKKLILDFFSGLDVKTQLLLGIVDALDKMNFDKGKSKLPEQIWEMLNALDSGPLSDVPEEMLWLKGCYDGLELSNQHG